MQKQKKKLNWFQNIIVGLFALACMLGLGWIVISLIKAILDLI
jgi:maltodextrin utilization protein YvdJ